MNHHGKYWIFLTLSAGMYALAFWAPENFWWLVFFFPVPVLYAATIQPLGFKEGFYWGVLSLGLHLWGILRATVELAEGSLVCKLLPTLVLLAYIGLISALFFSIAHLIQKNINVSKKPSISLAIWGLTLWGYYYFFDNTCLFPAGIWEGYCLLNPLLPLTQFPAFLTLLSKIYNPLLSGPLLLALLFLSAACFTYVLIKKMPIVTCIISIIALMPWLLSLSFYTKEIASPPWLSAITVVPWRFKVPLEDIGKALQIHLERAMQLFPNTKLIIMPEGAIHPLDLQKIGPRCFVWENQKSIDLLVGGTSWHDEKRYNTIYWVQNGCLKTWFYKRHAMLLIEYLAPGINCEFLKKLYFNTMVPLSTSTNARPLWQLFPDAAFTPYICSELFFNQKPDDTHNVPIIAFCGDHWCSSTYIRKLMYMAACYKAIIWQREIMYISYYYAYYCTKEGGIFAIDRLLNS